MYFNLAIGAIIFLLWALVSSVRIVREYERGVIFRMGKLVGAKGPGIFFIIPFGIDRMTKMDLRVITMDVPPQEVITRDNVPAKINAVVYFQVMDPCNAVVKVSNYYLATSQIAQTTLRSVLGQAELDELLSEREKINQKLQQIIDEQTDPWGIKVSIVEIKDVELPQEMKRAMAKQAEAERERRAKVIHAEGEFQASTRLSQAADIIAKNKIAVQLRYLQTLSEIAVENNSVTIFPIPIELISPFLKKEEGRG
jgi:regulator of protease activity HflC (stomatin/prohibitin superfamily)